VGDIMATVKVQVPFNVTYSVGDHVYREGDVFEVERADVEAFIRHGNLVEVKPAKKRS
jgi:hypothetical protein